MKTGNKNTPTLCEGGKIGRPKEKIDSVKITLTLEREVIELLNKLSASEKCSRSRIVEMLTSEAWKNANKQEAPPGPPASGQKRNLAKIAMSAAISQIKRHKISALIAIAQVFQLASPLLE